MSVNNTPPVIQHDGNGATKSFNYPFKILNGDDLVAQVGDAILVHDLDYTVTGVGDDVGGQVVFVVAPVIGVENVTLSRQIEFDRSTDYQYQGPLPAKVVNEDLDRVVMMLQQVGQDIKRSFKLPFATFTNQELTQTPVQRANKAIVFDADGNLNIGTDNYNDQAAAAAASASAAQAAAMQTGSDVVATGSNATAAANAAQAAIAAANSIDPNDLVHRSGTETIGGQKNFTLRPVVGTASPGANDAAAASTAYADSAAAAAVLARMHIKYRQWVQYGPLTMPTTGNPAQPDLIQQSQIGNLLATGCILKCSLAPTLFSAANGYNADGSDNNLNWLATVDIPIANLAANSTCYIWVDPVAKSAGFVTVADTDQSGGTIPLTINKYTYDYANKKMYLGAGATAAQVNRVIVGEIDTSATAITGVRVRPYKGDYEGDFTATLPAAGVAFSRNHNFGTTSKITVQLELECTTNDNGWVVGDRMESVVGTSANLSYLNPANITRKRNTFTDAAGSGTAWIGGNPTSGNGSTLTLASWKWRFTAKCRR